MLPCVYAESHKTERDIWDVIKDGTIYKKGITQSQKSISGLCRRRIRIFLLTRGKRQLLAQKKSTREIQTGEQVTASSPLLLETGCI